jgi:hypothetical protein
MLRGKALNLSWSQLRSVEVREQAVLPTKEGTCITNRTSQSICNGPILELSKQGSAVSAAGYDQPDVLAFGWLSEVQPQLTGTEVA